jgi:hypothetical protein
MYAGDRIAFAYDCLGHLGQSLAFYQEEILGYFDDGYSRVAVRGPHGVGKTFLSAILTHHSVLTATDDCKVITTASAWRQLEYYLWPEIKKLAKVLDWSTIGREPYDPNKEMFQLKILLNGGTVEAFGVASDDYNTIEGAHAHTLVYILDEAKAIPRNTWNAAEGAFANSTSGKSGMDDDGELVAEGDGILDGLDTIRLPVYNKAERKRRADLPDDAKKIVSWQQQIVRTPAEDHTLVLPVLKPITMIDVSPSAETVAIIPDRAIAFAISTPGDPAGQFYDIHMHKPGYEDWLTKHVTVEDAIRAGRIDANWVRMRARQWGETSSLFLNRVLGEFADSSEDGIIPRSWVLMACERWKTWKAEGGILPPGRKVIGVDTARQGMDKTVCAVQQGFCIPVIYRYSKLSMTALAGYVKSVADGAHLNIEVDGGLGASLYDILHSEGVPSLHAITVGSSKVLWQDKSKKLKFFNVRAAMWWNMRELLDPDEGEGVMLPPNEDLILDLTAPRLKTMQKDSTILVESKADIRDRIGRSTDYGDATCLALWKMHTGGGIVV